MKHTFNRTAALPALGLTFVLITAAHSAVAQQATTATAPAPAQAATAPRTVTEVRTETKPADASAPMPAQEAPQANAALADEYEPEAAPLQVGDATQSLLAWQRNGDVASTTPRPIPGEVANRSYERYLKSFEFPIPERMISSVKSSNSGSSSK